MVLKDPQFARERQLARHASFSLDEPRAAAFLEQCEFVSLGSFCAVSTALQALGLRRHAYPFDWVRCPLDGVAHCLETDFEDFLTFTTSRTDCSHQVFSTARWGGSFWHHDPEAPDTQEGFSRRIERLLGLGEVAASTPRVFVRVVNSTRELDVLPRLQVALQRALPEAKVYVLVLIDLQQSRGPLRLADDHRTLFYRLHESVWEGADAQGRDFMKRSSDAYQEAIAFALHFWAASPEAGSAAVVQDLAELGAALDQFDGGSPACESFWPRRYRGQRVALRRTLAVADGQRKDSRWPSLLAPCPQGFVDVRLPAGIRPGDFLETKAFGRSMKVKIPEGTACVGQLVRLRYADGVVTLCLAAATATVTATASSEDKNCTV